MPSSWNAQFWKNGFYLYIKFHQLLKRFHKIPAVGTPGCLNSHLEDLEVQGLNLELPLPETWGHTAFCPQDNSSARIPCSHSQPRKRIPQLHGVQGVVMTSSPHEWTPL